MIMCRTDDERENQHRNACMCFKCACLGDCPYSSKHITSCRYYLKSRLTAKDLSVILQCDYRKIYSLPRQTISKELDEHNIALIGNNLMKNNIYIIKIKFMERRKQVNQTMDKQ